jgi:hypothetical protein
MISEDLTKLNVGLVTIDRSFEHMFLIIPAKSSAPPCSVEHAEAPASGETESSCFSLNVLSIIAFGAHSMDCSAFSKYTPLFFGKEISGRGHYLLHAAVYEQANIARKVKVGAISAFSAIQSRIQIVIGMNFSIWLSSARNGDQHAQEYA